MLAVRGCWGQRRERKPPHRLRPKTAESFDKLRTGSASPLGEGKEAAAGLGLAVVAVRGVDALSAMRAELAVPALLAMPAMMAMHAKPTERGDLDLLFVGMAEGA